MVNQRSGLYGREFSSTEDSNCSLTSSAYSLPSMNLEAAAAANGRLDHLDFSLVGDIDALCKRDPQFLAVLPAKIKGRIFQIWAEDVKDYRFYGEDTDEEKEFDTEARL